MKLAKAVWIDLIYDVFKQCVCGNQMSVGLITCQNDYLCAKMKDTTMCIRGLIVVI